MGTASNHHNCTKSFLIQQKLKTSSSIFLWWHSHHGLCSIIIIIIFVRNHPILIFEKLSLDFCHGTEASLPGRFVWLYSWSFIPDCVIERSGNFQTSHVCEDARWADSCFVVFRFKWFPNYRKCMGMVYLIKDFIYLFDICNLSINITEQHEILVFSHGISMMRRSFHTHNYGIM